VGRRSRKRGGGSSPHGEGSPGAPAVSRAERDAARVRRAQAAGGRKRRPTGYGRRPGPDERPPAPWGSFPLIELVVLLAIVLGVLGVVFWGERGRVMIGASVALGCLAGLELSIREHFAGYRSHTTLLSGTATAAAVTAVVLASGSHGVPAGALFALAVVVFSGSFWSLREAFKRRSGGLGFR
jgi:hypothetical protein